MRIARWGRLISASLIGPLCTPIVMAATGIAFQPNRDGMLAALVISVFTLPFAYAATVVVGWPAFFLLEKLGRLSVGYAVGVGALAGSVVIVVLRQWLHPGFETFTALVASVGGCIVSGVLSAVLFYRIIATSPEPPNSAQERTSARRAW